MADLRKFISSPYLSNCPPLKKGDKGGFGTSCMEMLWTMNAS